MAFLDRNPLLALVHIFWLCVVTVSCVGGVVDVGFMAVTRPSFAAFVFVFCAVWMSLDLYLFGSLCDVLGHTPRNRVLRRIAGLWRTLFACSRNGPATLIFLSVVWIVILPAVPVEFFLYIIFGTPSWWNRWMLRDTPNGIVVPFVVFMCVVMLAGWITLLPWILWRACKAFCSVRLVLDDLATLEKARLTDDGVLDDFGDDDTVIGVDMGPDGPSRGKDGPGRP